MYDIILEPYVNGQARQTSFQTYQCMRHEYFNTTWINKIKDILDQCGKTNYWSQQSLHNQLYMHKQIKVTSY